MGKQKLRIGKFTYSNLFPLFYMLEKKCDCSMYEFVGGVPSTLNKLIRTGKIDVSPSSSIEYLRCGEKYSLLDGHSISSDGPVRSILLFTKKPIAALDGHTILTSSHSETSVALLEIILRKYYRVRCKLKSAEVTHKSGASDVDAYLLIGDDALKAMKYYSDKVRKPGFISYDLGELWRKYARLPFTYALWIYRKDLSEEKSELMIRLKEDLDYAKKLAHKNLRKIAKESPMNGILTEEEIVTYWKSISYDFGDEYKKGLELFRKYSKELGLI
ncbi:MAG: menaquinone biosynthesis protein [Nitrospirae bacterium]|nr:menaquinone biosynthesis protein [Nitrospirota bacterium]